MKKLLLVSLCFLLLCITQVFAQNRTVTGTVTAKEDGLPIPGVTVKVKGTTVGTQTNTAGKYSLANVPAGATLVFSFIGYQTLSLPATGPTLNAVLVISSNQLGEVVVTSALGIKRQAKELGYAATNISAKALTQTSPTNFTNGLTAKAPGLVISTLDNGIDPQTRFTLRGNRHIIGNNYALVLLNGVPISPNDVNTINPNDIESVDILNGAGAASLYGSEASNGALSITTKHGSSTGTPQVTYSNTFLAENISYFPGLQTQFGSYGGEGAPFLDPLTNQVTTPVPYENQSYGPRYDGSTQQLGLPAYADNGPVQMVPYSTPKTDPRRAFFQTGIQDQNNISYAAGDAANSFNLSANNVAQKGVVPNDRRDRTVVRVSATKTYGIFKADFTASYSHQTTSTYGAGFDGASLNGGRSLLSGILNSPSWAPINEYKDVNAMFGDNNSYFNSYNVNPYWTINNSRYNTRSDNFNGSFMGTLTPTKWFNLQYRLADNFGTGVQQYTRAQVNFSAYYHSDPGNTQNQAYGALGGAANTPGSVPGQVQNIMQYGDGSVSPVNNVGAGPQGYSRITQDIFANFHKTFFTDFKTSLLLGSSIWEEHYNQISNSSTQLLIDKFYNIGSILGVPSTGQVQGTIHQIAWLGSANISYKDYVFLEVSDRNDQDSRLSAANRSFWYPSAKLSFLLTDAIQALKNNKILSYAKLRASLSKVGDVNIPPYSIIPTFGVTTGFPYGSTGGLSLSTQLNSPTLKPEFTKELEFGGDFGFFDNRINAGITYYKSNTTNQTLPITVAPETGYLTSLVNIGEVENSGIETKLDIQVLTKQQNGFGLDLGGNFTIQNSKVLSLTAGLPSVTLTTISTAAAIQARVGQPFPVLMGTDLVRDPQGHPIVDANTGNPALNSNLVNLGQTNPKYLLGLTQTLSYKFVTLTVTSEFRTGNVIYNQGLLQATAAGTSLLSASSGRQQFVFPNSVIQTSPGVYTKNTSTLTSDGGINFFDSGNFYAAGSTYVTSGAFWKLREADLNFDLTSLVRKTKVIKRASIALIGRNLLMWRPASNTWTDPEFSSTSGNSVGYETNQLPPTRFFGANLTVTF
ncbi:MAG TPA: SusC/RagA family TonB-linked outer membrane protein [Mucilaginibacter sp.]|jgi:TonB-linked SusC/RagA family outer membrane protein